MLYYDMLCVNGKIKDYNRCSKGEFWFYVITNRDSSTFCAVPEKGIIWVSYGKREM
jgi:hypothetical protein